MSAFTPERTLREVRRQKRLTGGTVPDVCVLDPDGDVVRRLKAERRATPDPAWACYHTVLSRFTEVGTEFGILGCAVGAPLAVLLAEEFFASGCRFLISMTSAGQLVRSGAAVLHPDRTGIARRGHQLSLHGTVRVQHDRRRAAGDDAGRLR